MKVLKHISTEDVIAFDIETVRYTDNFSELSEDWQSAWEYKNKQDGEVPDSDELAVKWKNHTSLYPEFSKVCAVSLVLMSKGVPRCKNYVSTDERTLLRRLGADLNSFSKNRKFRLCGHASQYFDVPFLCKRYIANGLEIPDILDSTDKKPWEEINIDTNVLWKSFGTSPGSSLQALCTLLNVPISKVDLVGDGVGKAYYNGELTRIADYCNLDAIATFNVLRRMKRESIFSFDEVVYVNQGEVIEAVPFLTEIFNTKVITQEQAQIIRDEVKTYTDPVDVQYVKEILTAAVVKSKGVVDKNTESFINSL